MKKTLFLLLALLLPLSALAQQTTVDEYYGLDRIRTLRPASGALSAGETATAIADLQMFTQFVVYVNITTITTADADDEVDFYIQTTYDGGTTWVDLSNVHVDNTDNGSTQKTFIFISAIGAGIDQVDGGTDGTLTDDTNVNYAVGSQMRVKTAITGATAPTYAYTATAICWP